MSLSARWLPVAVLGIPGIAALYYTVALLRTYSRMADKIPVHFGLNGEPNGWMSKAWYAPLSVLLLIAMLVLFIFVLAAVKQNRSTAWFTVLLYSATMGFVVGAFLSLLQAASSGKPFHALPALAWALIIVVLQAGVLLLTGAFRDV
jgi:FtsH-binding integral membrane protein